MRLPRRSRSARADARLRAHVPSCTLKACRGASYSPCWNGSGRPSRSQVRSSACGPTNDQGKEMTRHQELSAATGVRVYFCDPHSPWQRGTCENTNGLLRQYLPKGTDLSIYSQDELDAIADSLNHRPRATHDFRSPLEVFATMLATACQPSTPIH